MSYGSRKRSIKMGPASEGHGVVFARRLAKLYLSGGMLRLVEATMIMGQMCQGIPTDAATVWSD